MKKIYLVTFKNKNGVTLNMELFTNRRKAEQYKRYWDANIRLYEEFKNDHVDIIEKKICTIDYTKAANKAEMELLPY